MESTSMNFSGLEKMSATAHYITRACKGKHVEAAVLTLNEQK